MKKQYYKIFTVTVCLGLLSSQAFSMRYASVRDGAESILYGSEKISAPFLMKIIERIDEPETDPRRKSLKIRDDSESKDVVLQTAESIKSKLTSERKSLTDTVTRIEELLKLDLEAFDPIPLSYLLERIHAEY